MRAVAMLACGLLLAASAMLMVTGESLPSVQLYSGLVNRDVQRMLDLTSHVVEEVISVTVHNSGKQATDSYLLAFPADSHLAFVEALFAPVDPNADKDTPPTTPATPLAVVPVSVTGVSEAPFETLYYKVSLPKTLNANKEVVLQVHASYTRVLTPSPASIAQAEPQRVVFDGNAQFYSPYRSTKQTTQLKLGSEKVESYSEDSATKQGSDIVYGPFSDLEPFATAEGLVHYENNSPFVTVPTLVREIEVSHYGNVAVEEHYELLHTGAKLNTGFSRYEYQRQQGGGAPSHFRHITALIPGAATDIYYRDQIGNISTSHVREAQSQDGTRTGQLVFEVEPRFPMFGGWSDDFYLGYNLPLWDYLSSDDSTGDFVLNVTFGSPFPQAAIDQLEVRVILPEGASNIRYSVPFEIDSEAFDTRVTYLDTTGRPVLVLRKANVVRHHNLPLIVSYEFSGFSLAEPLLLAAAFATFFAAVMLYVRLDLRISTRQVVVVRRTGPVADAVNTLIDNVARIVALYNTRNPQAANEVGPLFTSAKAQIALIKIAGEKPLVNNAVAIEDQLSLLKSNGKKYVSAVGFGPVEEARAQYAAVTSRLDALLVALRAA